MYDESAAKTYFEANAITDDDWEELDEPTKRMIGIEAICDPWPEVSHMRECGIPERAVILHIKPEYAGLDHGEIERAVENEGQEMLTSYVMQNATSHVGGLFTNSSVTVCSVGYTGENVTIEVEPKY